MWFAATMCCQVGSVPISRQHLIWCEYSYRRSLDFMLAYSFWKKRRNKKKKHISEARAMRWYVISLIHLLIPNSMFSVYSKTKTLTFTFQSPHLDSFCSVWHFHSQCSLVMSLTASCDLSYVNIAHNRVVMISDHTQLLCFMLNFV